MLVLVVAVTFGLLSGQNEIVVQSKSSTRKLFLGTRKKLVRTPVVKYEKIVTNECEAATSQLEGIDFNLPTAEWVERLDVQDFDNCKLPEFKDRIASIKANCFEKIDEQTCNQQAIFFRSLLRTRGVTEAEDQDLLADLVISEFADNTPDFHKLETYSEKLMNLDPNQAAYQKLWASSKVVASMDDLKSPSDLAEELAGRVDESIWNDSEMQSLKMAVATDLNPNNVEDYARGYLTKRADPRMHEALGWALWQQNRKAEAIGELRKAITLAPTDKWLKVQLAKAISKSANRDTYQARISLGVNLQDLYN